MTNAFNDQRPGPPGLTLPTDQSLGISRYMDGEFGLCVNGQEIWRGGPEAFVQCLVNSRWDFQCIPASGRNELADCDTTFLLAELERRGCEIEDVSEEVHQGPSCNCHPHPDLEDRIQSLETRMEIIGMVATSESSTAKRAREAREAAQHQEPWTEYDKAPGPKE